MKSLVSVCFALLVGCWTASAGAALVSLDGTCASTCSHLGLADGNAVSARFDVQAAGGFSNLSLSKADVTGFTIDFGDIEFGFADLTNWDFRLSTDSAGAITDLRFLASFGSASGLGNSVDIRLGNWFAVHSGACARFSPSPEFVPCDFTQTGVYGRSGPEAQGSSGSVTIENVPEPASLALALAAFAGLGLTRRPRR